MVTAEDWEFLDHWPNDFEEVYLVKLENRLLKYKEDTNEITIDKTINDNNNLIINQSTKAIRKPVKGFILVKFNVGNKMRCY